MTGLGSQGLSAAATLRMSPRGAGPYQRHEKPDEPGGNTPQIR